jgi:hypothetical protein
MFEISLLKIRMARGEGKLVRAGLKLAIDWGEANGEGLFSLLRCGCKCFGMLRKQVFSEIFQKL